MRPVDLDALDQLTAEDFTRIWMLAVVRIGASRDHKVIDAEVVEAALDYITVRATMTMTGIWWEDYGLARMREPDGRERFKLGGRRDKRPAE